MSGEIKLTDAQTTSAKDAFNALDKKGEGHIKCADISTAMKKIGHNIKTDWLEKMEELIDTEGTGYVEIEEFLDLVKIKIKEDEDERELKELFRVLDKDKTGEVSVMELRWILKRMGDALTEEDVDNMIAAVDTDGSGFIDFDEFSKLMLS